MLSLYFCCVTPNTICFKEYLKYNFNIMSLSLFPSQCRRPVHTQTHRGDMAEPE